jgi:D-glucuronyl C5-epimerase C-terminus
MPSRTAALFAALAAVLATAGSAMPAKQAGALAQIKKGLDLAVSSGQLDQPTADGYATIADRAVALVPKIPPLRAETLKGMMNDIAGQADDFSPQWALTLFSMLRFNVQTLATQRLPPSGTDKYDADGVLYRFVTGHGYEFHPLGEFGALNTLILTGKTDQAKQLADSLVARGVPKDGRLLWSYPFPFGRGQPPWRSGMAQAVAAQALARVGQALNDQDLLAAAGEAYAAVPGRLVRALPAGPWIKLYSFDAAPVLNAQLQSAISIGDYAQISGNTGAAGLAAQLLASAEALLPRFDTGYWSLYSLGGNESPFSYHDYVVQLLKKLATRNPSEATWRDFATRFQGYESQSPILKPSVSATADAAADPIVIYPDPQDGYLDSASFTFWLSKLSTVTLHAGGKASSYELGHGTRTITWWPGPRAPGTYYPYLTAVDAAGNSTKISLRQVVLQAVAPPQVDAHVGGRRTLFWTATDAGTPWLHLVVRLDSGSKRRYRDLGHRALAGRLVIPVPAGTWQATLVAGNSAHQAVTIQLGAVTGS